MSGNLRLSCPTSTLQLLNQGPNGYSFNNYLLFFGADFIQGIIYQHCTPFREITRDVNLQTKMFTEKIACLQYSTGLGGPGSIYLSVYSFVLLTHFSRSLNNVAFKVY